MVQMKFRCPLIIARAGQENEEAVVFALGLKSRTARERPPCRTYQENRWKLRLCPRPGAFFVSYVTFKISDLLARGFLGLSESFNDLGQFFLLLSVYLEIIRRKGGFVDLLDLRLILVQHGEPCGVPVAAFTDDGLREEAVKSKAESLRGAARPDGALQESHFHS